MTSQHRRITKLRFTTNTKCQVRICKMRMMLIMITEYSKSGIGCLWGRRNQVGVIQPFLHCTRCSLFQVNTICGHKPSKLTNLKVLSRCFIFMDASPTGEDGIIVLKEMTTATVVWGLSQGLSSWLPKSYKRGHPMPVLFDTKLPFSHIHIYTYLYWCVCGSKLI